MTRRRYRPGDPFEDLLDGRASSDAELFELLSAARAPGSREELAGLTAARDAFLDLRQPRRAPARKVSTATGTAARRLIALKAMAAISGATMIGGVAYAATEANLLGGGPERHGRSTQTSASAGPRDGQGGGSATDGTHGDGAQRPGPGTGLNSVTSTHVRSSVGLGLPGGEDQPGPKNHPAHSHGPAQPHPTRSSHPSHATESSHPSRPSETPHSSESDPGSSASAERSMHPEPTPSGSARP